MANLTYRAVNPRSEADITKFFSLIKKLSEFCNDNQTIDADKIKWARVHMGAIELLDKFKDKPLEPLNNNADEFSFVCEKDGEFVGYISVCAYHVVNGERPDDDIGIIHEIYVNDEHRNGTTAYTLLQLGLKKLIECGKTRAICNVQEDNPYRYLHFAMADGNIIKTTECKRANGDTTTDYTLLIDLKALQKMSFLDLAKKTAKFKRETANEITK